MKTRLDIEKELLRQNFPHFRLQDPSGPTCGVIGKMASNNGNVYMLWMSLRAFPNSAPSVYILQPEKLKDCHGRLLSEISEHGSHAMHLLAPDAHGHPQICHYNGHFWHPNVTIVKILLKARIWLEAYEQHLRYRRPLDTYLGHMQA